MKTKVRIKTEKDKQNRLFSQKVFDYLRNNVYLQLNPKTILKPLTLTVMNYEQEQLIQQAFEKGPALLANQQIPEFFDTVYMPSI